MYTRYYGREGNAAPQLASDALSMCGAWETAIEKWQKDVLDNDELPKFYRSTLFNELYVGYYYYSMSFTWVTITIQ